MRAKKPYIKFVKGLHLYRTQLLDKLFCIKQSRESRKKPKRVSSQNGIYKPCTLKYTHIVYMIIPQVLRDFLLC